MDNVATQICSQCQQVKELTTANFGVNTDSKTGFRSTCKICYASNRSAKQTREEKALQNHKRIVAAAKKKLENPSQLSVGELHKLENLVRLADKHQAKLAAKVDEQRKAEEAAKFQQPANPSLARVQAQFGSAFFIPPAERGAVLEELQAALATLTGSADGPARDYVESNIAHLEEMLANTAERESFLVRQEQDTLNERVSRRVIGKMYDLYLPQIRAAITAEAKISLREKIRDRKKQLMAMAKMATGKDSSGAEKAVVAETVANALEKLALMLYHGTKAPLPSDTLANLESRLDTVNAMQEWLETEEAKRQAYWQKLKERDPKQFERESRSLVLQIRGESPLADMQRKSMAQLKRENPAEYERRALEALKPRNVAMQHIVYVVMEGKHEVWYWPDGRLVKKGEEVTYDARTKRYCLMPAPAGVELDPVTATGRQKMELNQHDDGSFHWEPEGSQGTWSQQKDGTWKQDAGSGGSPWTKQERITFRRAEPHVEGSGKDNFRHGSWWSDEEIKAAEAVDLANPPSLLPPLPNYALADSLALPPAITVADRLKDAKPLETVWQRADRLRREQAIREAELLRN